MTATPTEPTRLLFFSNHNDLHALGVQAAVRDRGVACHVVETNVLCHDGGLRWTAGADGADEAALLDRDGVWVDLAAVDLVWWRRANMPQIDHPLLTTPDQIDLAYNEWRAGVFGCLRSAFVGVWVNDPTAELTAGNKLVQLRIARRLGFRVPKTFVGQDPAALRHFSQSVGGRMVVKPLLGTHLRSMTAVVVEVDQLDDDASVRLCPAIYQEVIPGTAHLRINCFGATCRSVRIDSPDLDWRRNLHAPFTAVEIEPVLSGRVREVLDALGLRMGVVDVKLTPDGEPVWLEVNTQGQFLFGEALSGLDLTNPCADFLVHEARVSRRGRAVPG